LTTTSSLIATLQGSSYTDPEVFAHEQAKIFESLWFCAVRAEDLPRPGAFKTVQVGRENVIVVRGRDDRLRAFLNVCRHAGRSGAPTTPGPTTSTAGSPPRPTW
jgi:Rieske 2Fe-2S family protein